MKKVAVITDSNSGITQSEAKKLGIHVVPMPFFVNGDTFYEDISMSQDEFYGYLAQGADVMTSQPAPDTLMKLWDSVLECYDEIVYIPMSSGLSSSCGTAMMLSYEEKYENKVFVVDNQRISVTQRRSVMDAIELAQNGYDGKQIQEIFYETASTVHSRSRPFASSSGSQHDSHKQERLVGRLPDRALSQTRETRPQNHGLESRRYCRVHRKSWQAGGRA